MKRFSRIVCLVMVCAMLLAVPAYAAEQNQRASNFFTGFKAYCYEVTTAQVGIYFKVLGTNTMQEIGACEVKLQRSTDGSSWYTVKTFTMADYPQMIGTNTIGHATTLYWPKNPGYYYRAYVDFYAKNSTGRGYYSYYTSVL